MTTPGDGACPNRSNRLEDAFETDIGDRKPSEAVVDAVSALTDTEPTELTPLYRVVDPEALDGLCRSSDVRANPTVQFNYEGFVVTIIDTEVVSVLEP